MVGRNPVHIELEPYQYKLFGKLKVYFIHDHSACGFHRCFLPHKFFGFSQLAQSRSFYEDNVRFTQDPFMRPEFRESEEFKKLKEARVVENTEWADVVVMQRMASASAVRLMDLAKQKGKAVIHEVDDMCEMVPKGNTAYWYWQRHDVQKTHAECFARADLVTTTNARLARFYRERYGRPVAAVENYLDIGSDRWRGIDCKKGPGITVGWMGSESHDIDLGILEEVVPWLLKEYPNLTFEFLGHSPVWARGDVERVKVNRVGMMEFPKAMAHWDIGLIPIIDVPFNTVGKSDIKFLEYSLLNIATVAAKLNPYRRSVQQKATGLLATWDEPEDWKRKIVSLIRRENFRLMLAQSACSWTKKNRGIAQNIHRWFRIYADLVTGRYREDTAQPAAV